MPGMDFGPLHAQHRGENRQKIQCKSAVLSRAYIPVWGDRGLLLVAVSLVY